MKKIILTILIIFMVFSGNISAEDLDNQEKTISINFDFTRKFGLASNQFAVWVENGKGMLVKNLFVTDFTAGKGWEKRPESLPLWRKALKAAGIDGISSATPKSEKVQAVKETGIDGISSATPKSGKIQLEWDIKNENGGLVGKGTYKICIEANIKWENTVLFTCEIKIDDNITLGEITEKISGKGYDKQKLITNVEIK
ncbi:DUF2271 domain-containing protein [Treponema sp. OMZ 792]|uniref:DUF2271 domain-containing protein n=1 Tax=unclassified Treponema TaxID=2638727 RepID=UPI0020A4E54E|nr:MULTISPECIES: DUF2271 domain-containing protein [unclassified Treponema]UTC75954.1 DUF2271 domain-containing protein [Treponema sp. OMZ 792]UTC79954.1 DUF2271 domain-containing protein [Treponema sp. OMZ 798]